MKAIVYQNNLQSLEQYLKRALQENKLQRLPDQVQCALNRGTLFVLVQHPSDVNPVAEEVFAVLEAALQQRSREVIEQLLAPRNSLPVRLQLRIEEQRRPYRVKPFTLEATSAIALHSPPSPPAIASKPPEEFVDATAAPASPDFLSRLGNLPGIDRIPTPVLALGAAIGLLTLASGMYVLSRPCVVGQCAPLQTAQQLSQKSAQLVQPVATPQDVIEAYQDLTEANYLLSSIPQWSPYYKPAQSLLQTYEGRAAIFGQVVGALKQAQTAAEKSQNPPHPLSTWRDIQQTWRGAIAKLEQIPVDSPIYLLAQRKLREYQANLAAIDRRIRTEQRAQERVNSARSVAAEAENRETTAKSAQQWRSIYSTWEVAVAALRNVPRGSMAYGEAQQLLAIYQPRLATARNRQAQEQVAADAYTQALTLADQARAAERQENWSEAIAQWREALMNAEQVPQETSYHPQAQSLVTTYKAELLAATNNLQVATVRQAAELDLQRACSGASPICTYTMGEKAIEVRLTSAYDWAVQSVILNTPPTNHSIPQVAIRDYVNQLLRLFASASKKAQLPLDLYNSDNRIFSSYDTNLDGFVAR